MITSLYKLLLKKNEGNGTSKESILFISNCDQDPNILPILLENSSILGVAPRRSGRKRYGPILYLFRLRFHALTKRKTQIETSLFLNANMLLMFRSKGTAKTI